MNFKAVIFDMDGVLVDSMLYWMESDRLFLKEILGFDVDNELEVEIVSYMSGRHEKENMAWLMKRFNLGTETIDSYLAKRKKYTEEIYDLKSEVMPGVVKLLEKLKTSNTKVALATGAPLYKAEKVINRFCWANHFCLTVSAEHVDCIGKPDPRIYLYTAEKLGIDPKDCVVIEDAENGVVAAKLAGMKCIAVPDSRWSFGDFSKADLIADSLEDKKVYEFLGL